MLKTCQYLGKSFGFGLYFTSLNMVWIWFERCKRAKPLQNTVCFEWCLESHQLKKNPTKRFVNLEEKWYVLRALLATLELHSGKSSWTSKVPNQSNWIPFPESCGWKDKKCLRFSPVNKKRSDFFHKPTGFTRVSGFTRFGMADFTWHPSPIVFLSETKILEKWHGEILKSNRHC